MAFTTLLEATRRRPSTSLWKKVLVRIVVALTVLGVAATIYGMVLAAFAAIAVAGTWMFIDAARRYDTVAMTHAVVIVLLSGIGVASMVWIMRISLPL